MERERIPYIIRTPYVITATGQYWCMYHQNIHFGDAVKFVLFNGEKVPVCAEFWLREVKPKPADSDPPCMQRGCQEDGVEKCRVCGFSHCVRHLVREMCEECRTEANSPTGDVCTNFPSCNEPIYGRCDVCGLTFCDRHMTSKDLCEWCNVELMSGGRAKA